MPMEQTTPEGKPFLGVYFVSCNIYGRLYKTAKGDAYAGHCPRCAKAFRVAIGQGGSSERFFKAFCQ